jgi:hypothetical protein
MGFVHGCGDYAPVLVVYDEAESPLVFEDNIEYLLGEYVLSGLFYFPYRP